MFRFLRPFFKKPPNWNKSLFWVVRGDPRCATDVVEPWLARKSATPQEKELRELLAQARAASNSSSVNRAAIIRALLACGANANATEIASSTALMDECQLGGIGGIKELLACGGDPKARNSHGETALIIAAKRLRKISLLAEWESEKNNHEKDRVECLAALLPASDPLAAENDGKTALMHCAWHGDPEAVRLLLPVSDARAKDRSNMTAIAWAAVADSAECVKILLPHSGREAIQTAFMAAAEKGHAATVELLLAHCDPKQPNLNGDTALILAAGHKDESLVKILLPLSEAKAANKKGETALMTAAQQGREQSVRRLLPLSDASAVDNEGRDAIWRAMFGEPMLVDRMTQEQRWASADFLAQFVSEKRLAEALDSAPPNAPPMTRALAEQRAIAAVFVKGPESAAGFGSANKEANVEAALGDTNIAHHRPARGASRRL